MLQELLRRIKEHKELFNSRPQHMFLSAEEYTALAKELTDQIQSCTLEVKNLKVEGVLVLKVEYLNGDFTVDR